MKNFLYKTFKFFGDAFLTSLTEHLRKQRIDMFNITHRYQIDQFEECYHYFKKYAEENKIKAQFWLAENSYHVDGMFKYPDLYATKMRDFFETNLK